MSGRRCEHCGGPLFRKRHIMSPRVGEVAHAWDGFDTNRGPLRCRLCGLAEWSSVEVLHGYNTSRRLPRPNVNDALRGVSPDVPPTAAERPTSQWLPANVPEASYADAHSHARRFWAPTAGDVDRDMAGVEMVPQRLSR